MFSKGNDLEKLLPEIAKYTVMAGELSSDHINGYYFTKSGGKIAGNLFAIRGDLNERQLARLKRLHNIGRGDTVKIKQDAKWRQFSAPLSTFDLLQEESVGMNGAVQLYDVVYRLNDEGTLVFVNGRSVDYHTRRWDYLHSGDVVVVISDDGEENYGSFLGFDDMPEASVYQETLLGPFSHDNAGNLWPSEVLDDRKIVRDLHLHKGDIIICPRCGTEDCDGHTIDEQRFYVRRPSSRKFLYAFKSPMLIGKDATEQFKPFAPVVVNHEVVGLNWPFAISKLTIDGNDHTRSTCEEEVSNDSHIEVTLCDPRKRYRR